jgi:gluconate 5-dehydrogenase
MVRAGAHVVLAGRREELLRTAADKLGDRAGYIAGDVTDTRGAEEFARTVEEKFGPVSILVNNAGIHHKQPFLETAYEDFDKVLRTHVSGSFVMSKAFAPSMAARKHGHFLFIASMTPSSACPRSSATRAKSAVGGMVRR